MKKTMKVQVTNNEEVIVEVKVRKLVEKVMSDMHIVDNKRHKTINWEVENESKTKRKYIRTKQKNTFNTYADVVIEEIKGGVSFFKLETESQYINDLLNKNYCKGQYVYNRTGEKSKFAYIIAQYYGSEKEGKTNEKEPKFDVLLLDENMKFDPKNRKMKSRYLVSKAKKEDAIFPKGFKPTVK